MLHYPSHPLKFNYPVIIRITGLFSILLIISLMLIFPRILESSIEMPTVENVVIEQVDIPQTEQVNRPPPPARPAIPIESESEDIADDLTIEETTFDEFAAWDEAPPPPDQGPQVKFIPYDEPPQPIGGFAAIQRNVVYPPIAQEAGIEGRILVQAFIDKKGRVKETSILQGLPGTGLDEAAIAAIRKTRFKPAKQRETPIGVWISIPVNFKLTIVN